MRKIYLLLACASLVFGAVSCEKDNNIPDMPEVTTGVYILNNGKFGSNNSSIMYYDFAANVVTPNVFLAKNGKKLGDTGQSMAIYGSKMYIAVYNSGVLFVTDKQTKIIKEITLADYKQPYILTPYQGKIYATYYDGGLAQIDTATLEVKTIAVGANPEELKVANGKLYVANSGGMSYPVGNTVSVVDVISFKTIKEIKVADNPRFVEVDNDGDVYLISSGNYTDVSPTLQKIDSKTDVVKNIELSVNDNKGNKSILNPAWMAMGANNKLYVICGENDKNWLVQGKVYIFNTLTENLEGEFVTDGTDVKNFHYISADIVSGNVYVGSSDYINNGDMYIFSSAGKLIKKIETGLNPIRAYFLTNK